MYARYIPPKPVASAQSTAAQTRAITPRDGFSYARYVPSPKLSNPAKEKATIQYFDDHRTSPRAKRKREAGGCDGTESSQAGGKKPRKADAQREDEAARHEQLPSILTEPETKRKKKNRRKRKQRTRAADDDSDESEDHDSPSDTVGLPSESAEIIKSKIQNVEELQSAPTAALPNGHHKKSSETLEPVAADSHTTVALTAGKGREKERKNKKKDTDGKIQKKRSKEEEADRKEKGKERKGKGRDGAGNGAAIQEPVDEEEDVQRHKAILKRKEISLKLASVSVQETPPELGDTPAEPHGLEPLPQPLLEEEKATAPAQNALPNWLAKPVRVSQNYSIPFQELGILPKAARVLAEKGFKEAFAVQTAAIPLLIPSSEERPGDVLIAAATGSGKTLAYALPIVRDISQGIVTRLRALVVLPTRELVKQAQEVFEVCSRAYDGEQRKRVRVGIALGSQSIKNEQEALIGRESRYDPEAYEEACAQIRKERGEKAALTGVEEDLDLHLDPRLGAWEGEVADFSSKVDVLICTPGRLVEHMDQTPGFSLDFVRWLVVDEADKILAQSFQGWLDRVMTQFRVNKFGARDFPDMAYTGARKVILSATLTRDLGLLNQLALRRPQLIVLEEDGTGGVAEHTLPVSLKEFAIRVHESSLKPLYLLELLQGPHMIGEMVDGEESRLVNGSSSKPSSDAASSSSDSGSESSESSSNEQSNRHSDSNGEQIQGRSKVRPLPHALIFTKSNESALRLSRLLVLLDSSLAPHINTLTSATPTHVRRKTLRAFTGATSSIRLIIASDLVARGIDIPKLRHVINYDLPPSLAGYVHRVGRTARAGRSGCAWTLVGDDESGWFWGKIGKGRSVKRAQQLVRTRIEEMSEDKVERYQAALATLGKEAVEVKRRGVKERRQK